ncbi:MAG: anhydro-N-acetylmuramic acid kinase [Elusimicrobia bacterium]|nr:anhydro-N-acetylmuramic acid kinase [Elusimicrobiota bacterium]
MKTLAVGLMSGTSADGVTAALIRLSSSRVEVVRCETYPYSAALRGRVLGAAKLTTPELSRLNMELGEAFARAALKISRGKKPSVIGSHGQTVWHGPDQDPANTLQIGEASVIAERTGITVVADFRPRDMAAGGQGAPLVPAFDEFLFAKGPSRALVNIGGIANVSIVGNGSLRSAFDTGPGNGLMDLAVRIATKGRSHMDAGGRMARRGWANASLVERLLKHPYFRKRPPKSLDKDFFGEKFLLKRFHPITLASLPDVLATLCLFTARSIAESVPHDVHEVVVSGGGALNATLMRALALSIEPARLKTSKAYGLPVMAKEAACFAWLGWRALNGKPNNCPQATGSRRRLILGKIVPS